ncbi:hypothetical protein ACLOJK_016514 [Asimina triloba]
MSPPLKPNPSPQFACFLLPLWIAMAAVTTPFFSYLSSAALLSRRNPNSSSLVFGVSPFSISISTRPNSLALRCAAPLAASAFEFAVAPERNDEDDFRSSENLDISNLGISPEIVAALSRRGITELFPIQRAVLEPAMEGRDLIGRAITGSGKTLAFGIPILDKIIQHRGQRRQKPVPSALILTPTRELARQVQKELKETAPRLSSACLYGGIPITNHVRALGFGVDIAVGTPGRIIDLIERGALDLSEVKFVVLDEADQMLNVGFQEAVECILSYLPANRQCMLFSATMPSWIKELSRNYLRDPFVIDLKYAKGGKSIIFTQTKKGAEVLSRSMTGLIGSQALHGNMQQFQRDKTLSAFREGRFNVLVATDVAARGLDIPNVDLVIHFEIPNTPELFVHRSGRTGRAGKKGTAVLIFTESQRRDVRFIERDLGCKFEELPKIQGDVVNTPRFMDVKENLYGQDEDSSDGLFGNYRRSRGPNYGSAGEMRGSRSSTFRRSSGDFEGYENTRSRNHHKNPGTRQSHFSKPGTQFTSYGGFEDNYFTSNANASHTSRYRRKSMGPKYNFGSRSFASERDNHNHDEWESLVDGNSGISEDSADRSRNRPKNPGARHSHFTKPGSQFKSYDDFKGDYFTKKATASQTSFRGRSKSMDPKYNFGSASFASERNYHDGRKSFEAGNSDNSEDDFEKILESLGMLTSE